MLNKSEKQNDYFDSSLDEILYNSKLTDSVILFLIGTQIMIFTYFYE